MAALAVTVASVSKSAAGQELTGVAGIGATITQGQPVYVDSATNTIKVANAASAGSVAVATVVGIATCAALAGQPITYCTFDTAFNHGFATGDVAPGQIVYLDDTAGGLTITYADLDATDFVCPVGIINATETTMLLRPMFGTTAAPVVKG